MFPRHLQCGTFCCSPSDQRPTYKEYIYTIYDIYKDNNSSTLSISSSVKGVWGSTARLSMTVLFGPRYGLESLGGQLPDKVVRVQHFRVSSVVQGVSDFL